MEEEDEGCREEYKKGLWTAEEDKMLMEYVKYYGKGHWNSISKRTGLKRCGKSCRLRWMNYLSPNVKKGKFTEDEEDLIIRLHRLLGNRWSLIAGRVPGRTDNQVKNYWNTHLSKKLGIFNKKKQKQTRATLVDSSTSVHCNGKKTTNIGMNPDSSSSVEINRKKKITGTDTTHFNPHTAENVSGKDGADICEKDDMRRKVDSDEVAADDEKTMEKEMQQPISGMVIVGSSEEDSMMSSTVASFWVSEFDKMMSSSSSGEGNSGSFMELIDDEHLFGFGLLDWNQF